MTGRITLRKNGVGGMTGTSMTVSADMTAQGPLEGKEEGVIPIEIEKAISPRGLEVVVALHIMGHFRIAMLSSKDSQ